MCRDSEESMILAGSDGWGCWEQASINPKVKFAEELMTERKNLHMGMLGAARKDLSQKLVEDRNAFEVLSV
jgi:hypothetical protein